MASKVEELRRDVRAWIWDARDYPEHPFYEDLDALIAAVREEERAAVERGIADALATGERGDNLVTVAREAHAAQVAYRHPTEACGCGVALDSEGLCNRCDHE